MIPRPEPKPKKLARDSFFSWAYLDPFWVGGLTVLCVLLGTVLWGSMGLGLEGERLEWSLYLTLGTIYPALLLAFALPTRFSGFAPTFVQTLKLAFAVLLVVVGVLFVLAQHQYYALLASATHLLLMYALRRANLATTPISVVMSVFLVLVSWTAAAHFIWWSPYDFGTSGPVSSGASTFDAWFSDPAFDVWFLDWKYKVLVFFLSLLLVFTNLYPKEVSESDLLRFRFLSAPNVAAILIFALASVRSDQLFNALSYYHWGVYVGPAEMVRQGGWLLWDVPSQYGFLSMLTVAFLPFESIWESLYVANSVLLFLSALFLFFVLRSLRAGFTNFCFSLSVTLAAVFLMPGWAPELLGPQIFPSVAAFRFFWVYTLLGVLVWEFQNGSKDPPRRILLGGCAVWLIGTLWSSESAIYCAAVWLPAYVLLISRKAANVYAEKGSLKSGLRAAASWLALPPLLLSAALGIIAADYAANLGHLPDWGAFFEYSASFGSGYGSLPIDVSGPVLALFLVFCAFSAIGAHFLRGGLMHRAIILFAGTWGALWAMSSYFVARSHPSVVTNLSPILCIVVGLALYLLAHHRKTDEWVMLVRTSFIPVLTVLLAAGFGNAAGLANYVTSPHAGYESEINSRLPVMDESLLSLLDEAQAEIDDPIVYVGVPRLDVPQGGLMLPARPVSNSSGTRYFSPPQTWLPTTPFELFAALPDERRELYMSRFAERARLSGWLVESNRDAPYTSSPWLSGQLQHTHEPTEVFENADWRLTWFEFYK